MKGTVETQIPFLTSLSYLQTQQLNQENVNSQKTLKNSIDHISTGLRVINAKDNLASFAIADRLDVKTQGLSKAIQNTNEALTVTRVAESSINEYIDILGYIKELAEKASNTSIDNSDRYSLQGEMEILQERLKRISDETTFRGRKLLDGTYRSQDILVGDTLNQMMSISLKSTRPDQIGLHQLVSEGKVNDAGNFRSSIYAAIDNGISTLDNLTIQGFMGSEYIEIADFSSARQIAAIINEKSDSTGVMASAKSYAKIFNLSKAGDMSFIFHGAKEVQINATIESTDDLTPLYSELESKFSESHITPKLSPDKDSIYLIAEEGDNIGIEDFYNNAFPTFIKFTGLQPDGKSIAGVENTLISEFQDSILVGGYVEFNSDEPFILFTGPGDALFSAQNTTQLPTLNALDIIDISLQQNAIDAIAIIDKSMEYAEKIRTDIKAYESGIEAIINRLESASEQAENSKHRIVDMDMAEETMAVSKAVIQIQSQNSLITQANKLIPEYSLFLLRQ